VSVQPTIFTVGHSTRTLAELVALVKAHGVQAIADVRIFPRSRRHPHFNDEVLAIELPRVDIAYLPFKSLGGHRKPRPDSINVGWRNSSFRGYADYMQTLTFAAALDELMHTARERPTAIMCAEAVPWRCHRSLIADALVARRWNVLDIINPKTARPHELPAFAVVVDHAQLEYRAAHDPAQPPLFDG
jgi:uncharacterized protein (DUF488 family)